MCSISARFQILNEYLDAKNTFEYQCWTPQSNHMMTVCICLYLVDHNFVFLRQHRHVEDPQVIYDGNEDEDEEREGEVWGERRHLPMDSTDERYFSLILVYYNILNLFI